MGIGPGPTPPWQWTEVDNGAQFALNEQPANEPPVEKRVIYLLAADKSKWTINTANGDVESGWPEE